MTSKKTRQRHSDEFKSEALKLAETTSAEKAATEIGLASSQLYNSRVSAAKKADVSDRETAFKPRLPSLNGS